LSIDSRRTNAEPVSAHIADILDRVRPQRAPLTALIETINAAEQRRDRARLWIYCYTTGGIADLDLDPEVTRFVGDLGAWLGVSLRSHDELE
jgi:hypothetical protein